MGEQLEPLTIDVDYEIDEIAELYDAVIKNHINKVKDLLSKGVDVNYKLDSHCVTPLHYAAYGNKGDSHFEMAEMLLEKGADPNAYERDNYNTPFFRLVSKANLKMIKLFLDFKADTSTTDSDRQSVLFQARFNENLEVIKFFVNLGLNVNHRNRSKNRTVLHYAAKENNLALVKYLLQNGAKVDARDNSGMTPLWLAVRKNNMKIIKLLLNNKADINVLDRTRRNLLLLAAEHQRSVGLVQLMIDRGLDVNHCDDKGCTPLYFAAKNHYKRKHYFRTMKLLLSSGANPNVRDEKNETPLFNVIKKSGVETIQLFLNFKADVTVVNNDGENLLFPAAKRYPRVMQLLLDLGLDINHRNKNGRTPLYGAVQHLDTMKLLLKKGAILNTADKEGNTPLMAAFYDVINYYGSLDREIKFIVKYTDFNVIFKDVSVLTMEYPSYKYKSYLWEGVVAHIAKLVTLNIPLHPNFLDIIRSKKDYNDYYEQCNEELQRAKEFVIPNTCITFYNLLVASRKRLKNFGGNKDLIESLNQSDILDKYPIYGSVVDENVRKGVAKRELFDESADLLSNCLPIFNATHLVIRDVLDCILSKKDLSKFCVREDYV